MEGLLIGKESVLRFGHGKTIQLNHLPFEKLPHSRSTVPYMFNRYVVHHNDNEYHVLWLFRDRPHNHSPVDVLPNSCSILTSGCTGNMVYLKKNVVSRSGTH